MKAIVSTATADGIPREEARAAVAADIGDDHAITGRRQRRCNVDKTINVIRPAVQQNDGSTIGRAGFGIADIEHAGIDLLERSE